MSAPLVSVAVLTYNQEKLLPQTLESIVSQDFPAENYEIVVGEDCSSDGTAQVLKEYAAKYPQIRPFYNPKNLGILKNYINLVNHCRGKYVMVCAGDDYWLPDKMRYQVDFMEHRPDVSLLYGNFYCVENGRFFELTIFKHLEKIEDLLKEGNCICAPSTCWRREFWQGYLKEIAPQNRAWFCEDYPLWLYLAQHGKVKYVNKNFCVYRFHSDNVSVTAAENIQKNLKMRADMYEIQLLFAEKYAPHLLPEIAQKILEKEKAELQ